MHNYIRMHGTNSP